MRSRPCPTSVRIRESSYSSSSDLAVQRGPRPGAGEQCNHRGDRQTPAHLPLTTAIPVDELSMNFASQRIDHRYLKVLIVAEALVTEVPDNFSAVLNGFGLCIELGPDYIPVRDAIFHIEEKLLHRCYLWRHQSAVSVFVPMSSPSTITNRRSSPACSRKK